MRCGVPVPSIISSLPLAACVIEVPRLYAAGLHNLVAQLLLSGVPVLIAGESADVKATVAALKATVAEDMYQCDVAIYNLSSKTPLYTSTSHLVSICSATALNNRLPRYVAFTEGPMSSDMPVEIFSFLLSLVPVLERAGNWFLLGTLSVYFASMMSTRFSKDCNVVCALLGEETVVPDEFVQSIRAAITNADTCPIKSWEDVYHNLGAGFRVDCSVVRYVDEDHEEQDGEAESQPETHTPKKKPKTAPAPSPSGTQCAQVTAASSSGTVAPTGEGMNTFVNHFSPSQGGNTQSQNCATAKPGAAAPAKPPANTRAKKPRASGSAQALMPVLLLILPVSMKFGRNFGQHAVLSLFSLFLLCFPVGTAKVCFDSSGGKYLLVIEYITGVYAHRLFGECGEFPFLPVLQSVSGGV